MAYNPLMNQMWQTKRAPDPTYWDQIWPGFIHSEGLNPRFVARPAPYLPVKAFVNKLQTWFVQQMGTPVCLDSNGDIIPYGLGLTTTTLGYTADDIGLTYLPDGSKVTASTVSNGVTLNDEFFGTKYVNDISLPDWTDGSTAYEGPYPIGVLLHNAYRWHGGFSNPAGMLPGTSYEKFNFQPQQQLTVTTDGFIVLPRLEFADQSESIPVGAIKYRIAAVPSTGTVAFSGAGAAASFINLVGDQSQVDSAGDYYVDETNGWINWYTATTAAVTVTYTPYTSTPYVHFEDYTAGPVDSALKPGTYVVGTNDGLGNYTVYDPAAHDWRHVIGQMWTYETLDTDAKKGYLNFVFQDWIEGVAYNKQAAGGISSQGMPPNIHLSNAIDTRVFVKILK